MKVLVVEDGRDEAQRYARELERAGFEAYIAEDVATAERLVRENSFGAALVDMGLPFDVTSKEADETRENPRNGLRLLHWIYDEAKIPVFALTGTSDPEQERLISFPLIRKPVNDFAKEVSERVSRACGQQRLGAVSGDTATAAVPGKMATITRTVPAGCALFVGAPLAALAARYEGRAGITHSAQTFDAGAQLLSEILPAMEDSSKLLVVVTASLETGRDCRQLRYFVDEIERHGRDVDPRLVLHGTLAISSFAAIRNLLWSHVVDWLPEDLQEDQAIERLDRAWGREGLRARVLGLGLIKGAPYHVASHQRSRLQIADEYHLERLFNEALFVSAMRTIPGGTSWGPLGETLYRHLHFLVKNAAPRWASVGLDLPQLDSLRASDLQDREQLVVLLRCWCGLLAEKFASVIAMTRKDLAELESFTEGLVSDFLRGVVDEH